MSSRSVLLVSVQHGKRRLLVIVISAFMCAGAGDQLTPRGGGSRSPEGTWDTGIWERQKGRVLEDIPETLAAERWTINRAQRCKRSIRRCALDVVTEALTGPPAPLKFRLAPAKRGRWRGDLDFVSMCVDRNTGAVREEHASDVTATYELEVIGRGAHRRLELASVWDGEPTEEGIAAGCRVESARFETTATTVDPPRRSV